MLGIKNFDFIKHRVYIENFLYLAGCGRNLPEDRGGHQDGWGAGWYENGIAKAYKSAGSAVKESEVYFKKLEEIGSSSILIVHFRKSSWKGTVKKSNSHPFIYGKKFIFAHNGTLYEYKKLETYKTGHLDSWTLGSYIVKNGVYAFKNIKNLRHSSYTFLFSDRKNLFALREYTINPDYYTLYLKKDGGVIISSEPLGNGFKILKKDLLYIF